MSKLGRQQHDKLHQMNLYQTWKSFYEQRSGRENLNKSSRQIVNITNPSFSPSDAAVWDDLKTNNKLIVAHVDGFGKEVRFKHHTTCIGGSIEHPDKTFVGLAGLGGRAQVINFDSKVLEFKTSSKIPSLEKFGKVTKNSEFVKLKGNQDKVFEHRQMITLPPFIAEALINDGSSDPSTLGIISLAAARNIKDMNPEDPAYDDIIELSREVAGFFWLAANKKINSTVTELGLDPVSSKWCTHIHKDHILPSGDMAPNPNEVAQPSNATMATLATNIATMTDYNTQRDEEASAVAADKKDKWKSWSKAKKSMLLNAMTVDGVSAEEPPEAFMDLINQKSISRVKEEIEAALSLDDCMCDVSLKFAAAVSSGEFIVQASEDPGKFSLFCLGMENASGLDSDQSLRIQLMSSEGKGLDRDTIEKIVKEKLVGPGHACNLKHLLKTAVCFFKRCWPEGAFLTKCITQFYREVECNEHLFLTYFSGDHLFGTKVVHRLDRHLQSLWKRCAKMPSPDVIGVESFSFHHIAAAILNYSFNCILPRSLIPHQPQRKRTLDESWLPSFNQHNSSYQMPPGMPPTFNTITPPPPPPPPNKKKSIYIPNPQPNARWKMDDAEEYKRCFPTAEIKDRPMMNNDTRCCARWAQRGYCFDTCSDKGSHCPWDAKTSEAWNKFQAKCRQRA